MKKLFLLLLGMVLLLANCSAAQQIENQAFVVILGLDTDTSGLEVTVQVPKIKGVESTEKQEDDAGFMVVSTKAKSFTEGIELLSVALPRRINLTQVKMIVVSDDLARQESFREVMREMAETYPLYATSYFTVCLNRTKDFIEAQQPIFSGSVTGALNALLEHHRSRGYIPISTFAEVYYLSNSVYSDPIAILAARHESGNQAPNTAEAPAPLFPDELNVDSESENEYAGGAVFVHGNLKCLLNARQMVLTNLVRGRTKEFTYTVNDVDLTLRPSGKPRIKIKTTEYPPRIYYEQTLQTKAGTEKTGKKEIEENIEKELQDLFAFCQSQKTEPFGFADIAASRFLSLAQWTRYDWRKRFAEADIQIEIRIRHDNS